MPKSKYKKKKEMYMSGGSIMVPPEREKYGAGSVVTALVGASGLAIQDWEKVINEVVPEGKKYYKKNFNKIMNKIDNLREKKAEGGSIMMPPEMATEPEMAMDMPVEEESIEEPMMDVPVDTYPNADPEEVEASQESDEVIEQDQMEMVIEKALDSKEQEYLMNALEGDEQLSQIFDKVLLSASEFSGSGEVDGLGDGTSDSIPARLSDGEFVMTQKATEQIGADNLQKMMDDAERAYDGGMMRKDLYGGGLLPSTSTDDLESNTRNTDDEIRKLMSLRANQAPSLR